MDLVFALGLVGIGGAAGGLVRFELGRIISKRHSLNFPVGTFIINITGAILLGIVTGINVDGRLYLLLADGFLGAYTTFSTFMYEGFHLFQGSKKLNAFAYIAGSFVLGVIGYIAGFAVGKLF